MPFTLSHPAAVLPLRTWAPDLPFGALVVGSMAPDVQYYLPFEPFPRHLTHSFVGVPTADLAVGLIALIVVQGVLAAPIAALLPRPWGRSVGEWAKAGAPRSLRTMGLIFFALVVGSLTHVGWDAFTHVNGQVVEHVAFLRHQAGHYPVYQWLQFASSAFGLAVIGLELWRHRWWGFTPLSAADREAWLARGTHVRAVPVLVVVSGIAFAAYRSLSASPQSLRFLVLTGAGEGVLFALALWSAAYWASSSASRWRR